MTDMTVTYYAPALEEAEQLVTERVQDADVTVSTYAATRALCLHLQVDADGGAAIAQAATAAGALIGDVDGLTLRSVEIDTDELIVARHTPGEAYQIGVVHESLCALIDAWLSTRNLERFPLPCRPASDDLPTFGIAPRALSSV